MYQLYSLKMTIKSRNKLELHIELTASVVWWLACWPLVPEFAGSSRWIFNEC
jgi:hypothetical protein